MNVIYIVVGFDGSQNKVLYAGGNRIRTIRSFHDFQDSYLYSDVWIEIWENEVQTDDEWRPIQH